MPWKTFNSWIFDGSKQSPVPDILIKPGSPISPNYLISLFITNGPLNQYLDKYLNNYWLFSVDKEELLRFIKTCVIDYKVKKGSLFFTKRRAKDKLYDVLRERITSFKNDDILLLSEIISKSPERNVIYETLGLDVPKVKKSKKEKPKKISQKKYLAENFNLVEIK